jgi:hypothetical protein
MLKSNGIYLSMNGCKAGVNRFMFVATASRSVCRDERKV